MIFRWRRRQQLGHGRVGPRQSQAGNDRNKELPAESVRFLSRTLWRIASLTMDPGLASPDDDLASSERGFLANRFVPSGCRRLTVSVGMTVR